MFFLRLRKGEKIQDNTEIKSDLIIESSSDEIIYYYNCSLLEIWLGWKIPCFGILLLQKRPHIIIRLPQQEIQIFKEFQTLPIKLLLSDTKCNPIGWYGIEFIDSKTHEKYLIKNIIERKQLLYTLTELRKKK